MNKIYTITGATGYIGRSLIEKLSKDKDNYIYAVIRKTSKPTLFSDNIEYIEYDETESSLENAIKLSDYLVHLGALYTTADDEESTKNLINSNILFSTLLFNVANRVNKNIVIASASTFSSLDENGNYEPATLYAATKSAVECLAHYYKDLSIHFLSLPDTYGPNDWRPKIHNILKRNKEWPFEFRSPGEQEMKMLHVDDINGHILSSLMNNDKGVHYHDIFSEGTLVNLRNLSKLITNNECIFPDGDVVDIPKEPRKMSTPTGYQNKHKTIKFN